MRQRIILLLIICILVPSQVVFSVPSRRNTCSVLQPDGSTLRITLLGDEFGGFLHTLDGIMVKSDAKGIYRYITDISVDSIFFDTIFIAHDLEMRTKKENAFLNNIDQRALNESFLNIRKAVKMQRTDDSLMAHRSRLEVASPGDYSTNNFPTIGSVRGILILVDFPDKSFSLNNADIVTKFNSMLNETGYKDTITISGRKIPAAEGSVKDYFEAQSYGKFSPEFDIIGPITADNGYAYYGRNITEMPGSDAYARELVEEVCQKAYDRGLVNYEDYDVNNDGNVDFVFIVYAGRSESYTGSDPNTIWPHQWSINKTFGNMSIKYYACSSELFYNSDNIIDGIGTICHEFSHILGLPDFYSTSDKTKDVFAMDAWSVMDYGCYDNYGFTPVGYTAFERFSIGWMEIDELTESGKYQLESISESEKAYRINSTNPNQFIILENHQKEGWYKYHESSGLMVTAVYYDRNVWNNNTVNNDPNLKRYYILPADNEYSYENSLHGDLFPYEGNDSITLNSLPAMKINGGLSIDKPLFNISNVNGIVTFDYIINNYTSVEEASFSTPVIGQKEGLVFVKAQSGTEVSVYSLSGVLVGEYNVINDQISFTLPKKGIYFLKVSGKVFKLIYLD